MFNIVQKYMKRSFWHLALVERIYIKVSKLAESANEICERTEYL
jgi:hypothetical protein